MRAVCSRVIGKLGRERAAHDNNASFLADRVTRIVLGEMLPFRGAILGFHELAWMRLAASYFSVVKEILLLCSTTNTLVLGISSSILLPLVAPGISILVLYY